MNQNDGGGRTKGTLVEETLGKLESGEWATISNGKVDLKEYETQHKREAQILAQGWEPWEVNREMFFGLLEKTPLRRGFYVGFYLGLLMLAGSAVSIWLGNQVFAHNTTPSDGALISGTLGAFFVPLGILILLLIATTEWVGYIRKDDDWMRGFPYTSYFGLMPKAVCQKWQLDKHLFDRVYVASHDASLFQVHNSYIRAILSDPKLVSRIGPSFHLGAQGDLGNELDLSKSKPILVGRIGISFYLGAQWERTPRR